MAQRMLCFLTAGAENAGVTGSLLANPALVWPVSSATLDFVRKTMTRVLVWLGAAVMVLAAGHAQAQEGVDTRDIMGGGPNFRGGGYGYGGGSPVARSTVMLQT